MLAAVPAMAAVWIMVPRPVRPMETPSLVLDGTRVRAVQARDGSRAERVPRSEAARKLEHLVRAQNRAEVGPGEPPGAVGQRRAALRRAVDAVRARHGSQGLAALRAEAARNLQPALAGALEGPALDAFLGSFPRMVRRYGLWVEDRRVAPWFVVRTLFKAQWNALVGLAPTDGLEGEEVRAYWGWLALHARDVDPSLRMKALARYADAGGTHIAEAHAVLALQAGRVPEAARWMTRAHEARGGLRLRNQLLWLLTEADP